MSGVSVIGKSIILVSAAVGSIVGFLELKDRFFVAADVPPEVTVGSKSAVSTSNNDKTIASAALGKDKANAATPVEAAPSSVPTRSVLEQVLWQRVEEQLERYDCAQIAIDRLTASAVVIPKTETSHGFVGHTLEGAVLLQVSEAPQRVRLVGCAKGPSGEAAAVDMALRGFAEQIEKSAFFKENCKGE